MSERIAISLPIIRYHAAGHNLVAPVRQAAQAATRTLAILGYMSAAPAGSG